MDKNYIVKSLNDQVGKVNQQIQTWMKPRIRKIVRICGKPIAICFTLSFLFSAELKSQYFIEDSFSNEFLCKNKVGKRYIYDSESNIHNIIVHWDNGFYLLGQVRIESDKDGEKEYPANFWYLYDKKSRLREVYSFSGYDCPVVWKVYKKNGELKSKQYSSPCI